jgi:hypothetical protein
MDALNPGIEPGAFVIRDVIRHEQSGLLVDPKRGVIYGVAGTPVGAACADGYVRLGGRRSGCLYAHRVVYEAVHGEIPLGLEIDHLNGRKADNRIRNLEAVTRAENCRRAIAKGLALVGEARSDSKLTVQLVREIRATAGTVTLRAWADALGVDKATIRAARNGTSWRHVKMRGRAKPSQAPGHSRNPRRPR